LPAQTWHIAQNTGQADPAPTKTIWISNKQQPTNHGGNMNRVKITLAAIFFIALAFTSAAFAANLPKNCTDEIVALSKGSSFSMPQFASDLPAAVVKAKAQAKLPFGKPKDSEKTSIGMTFGCLKVFPESPGEIQSLLKDVSQEIARGAVASQLGAGQQVLQQAQAQYQPQQAQPQYQYPPQQQAQPQYQYPPPQPPPSPPPQQAPPEYQQQAQPYYPPQQQAQPQYQQQPPQYQYPPLLVQCKQEKVICECSQQPARNYGQQAQTEQEKQYENFTGGQRFATWFLNTIFPIGFGSGAVMHDAVGMVIQMGLNGLGITFIVGLGTTEYDCDDRYYYNRNCKTKATAFMPIGIGLLGISAIYNIVRSATYGESAESSNEYNYSSNGYSGFNLAILPNEHGKFMPYVMYNKTF
jgi:hypothetical protein